MKTDDFLLFILGIIEFALLLYGNIKFFQFSSLYEKRSGKYMRDNFILWSPKREEEFMDKYHDDKELIEAFLKLKKSYKITIATAFGLIIVFILIGIWLDA